MIEKYRVHEVAKDLGVNSKEIVELLEKHFPDSGKKHMATLEKQELNVIFQHYTKENSVEDLDTFFAASRKEREEEAAKEAQKAAKKKAEAAKEAAKKPVEKKPAAAKKPAEQPAGKSAAKPAAESAAKPAAKSAAKPAPKKKEQRPPQRPRMQTTELPVQQKASGPAVTQTVEEDTQNRVNMRTVKVNLDKYNERYETIAPTNVAPQPQKAGSSRQKFNKKRGRKGRPYMSRKEKDDQKRKHMKMEEERRQNLHVYIPEEISVVDLAARLKINAGEIVKELIKMGVMVSAGEMIDYDTAAMVSIEIGATAEPEVLVTIEDILFEEKTDEEGTEERPAVVVVMGHVDHGKTSTLDAIRETQVTAGEAGGITQHIGAYQVEINDRKITFLDTPGHAAFTSMRARGASITDIAVIVVAADDGIMPQTVEAINHANAAGVSIIIAVNKIDKPEANPTRVMQELTEHGIVPEEWGGDTPVINISAKTGEGLPALLEMIQLMADVKELKANPGVAARGTVVEARLDRGRGPVATLLVQEGTLRPGDVIIAGTAIGRVRQMFDDNGDDVEAAEPSTPVEITGLGAVPLAGDVFNAVANERLAKELVDQRKHQAKEEVFSSYKKVTLDNLFDQISEGEMKELAVIVKADVQGSVEAVTQSLEKISNEEVRVRVIHSGVGAVSESDVMLANASNAIIVGFNVRPDPIARENAKRDDVDVRLYRVIYDAIEELESAMKGMLDPKFREVDLGRAEVREVFKITNVGAIAGCYVTEGKITRGARIRVVRDGIIIADDEMDSLRRFKDDVKEVAHSYECGIGLDKFNDIKVGDFLEAYIMEEYRD